MAEVLRTQKIMTNDIQIGDQIKIPLTGLGEFTATAHKISDNGILFVFDECICTRQMNKEETNKGGYEASDLKKWIDNELINLFPNDLRNRITDLSIPTYGMIFGRDYDEWDNEHFEADEDDQLELMKLRKNRIPFYNDNLEWYWLRNAMKKEYSVTCFARVGTDGDAHSNAASYAGTGVRPSFVLYDKMLME